MKVLITGSAHGIGRAAAVLFLSRGHEVVGLDVAEATIEHPMYVHHVCDVRGGLPAVESVNVLVCAAGIQLPDDDTIDVNLKGTIRTVEAYALQPAIESVVTVASASATSGSEFPCYSASKGGVVTYTKNLALRLAPYGATANSLSPGGVLTESNAPVTDNAALYRAVLEETLLGKWATPEEMAEWIYFLSVVNRSMTGQDVLVDNGEIVKSNFIWPKN